MRLGNICRELGILPKARKYYESALEIYKGLTREADNITIYDHMAHAYCYLGTSDMGEMDHDMLGKALNIWTRLAEQCPNVEEFSANASVVREWMKV